jgi:hypothetical protein
MKRYRVALLLCVLLEVFGSMAAAPAVAATPQVSCSLYSCVGHDPVHYGCSGDATTSTSWVLQDDSGNILATLWKRLSAKCNAYWARAQLTTAAAQAGNSYDILAITNDSRDDLESECFPGPSDTGNLVEDCTNIYFGYTGTDVSWSDMVADDNDPQVDILVYDRNGNFVNGVSI